jgi:hypothetical protein
MSKTDRNTFGLLRAGRGTLRQFGALTKTENDIWRVQAASALPVHPLRTGRPDTGAACCVAV